VIDKVNLAEKLAAFDEALSVIDEKFGR